MGRLLFQGRVNGCCVRLVELSDRVVMEQGGGEDAMGQPKWMMIMATTANLIVFECALRAFLDTLRRGEGTL